MNSLYMRTEASVHVSNPHDFSGRTSFSSFKIDLWLVGPEISMAGHTALPSQLGPRMTARCYRGTLSDFLKEHSLLGEWNSRQVDAKGLHRSSVYIVHRIIVHRTLRCIEHHDRTRERES